MLLWFDTCGLGAGFIESQGSDLKAIDSKPVFSLIFSDLLTRGGSELVEWVIGFHPPPEGENISWLEQ